MRELDGGIEGAGGYVVVAHEILLSALGLGVLSILYSLFYSIPRSQVPGPRSQVPGPKSQVPSPKSQVPSPKSQVPVPVA